MATFSSGVKCFRSFLIRSLRYLNGQTLSPFPTEAGQYLLSLACCHASGIEFDRSEFTGDEKSQTFGLLRDLGFHIERKDFVQTLLETFLKQARARRDLSTKGYPNASTAVWRGRKGIKKGPSKASLSKSPEIFVPAQSL
jgi:hypothetical protein